MIASVAFDLHAVFKCEKIQQIMQMYTPSLNIHCFWHGKSDFLLCKNIGALRMFFCAKIMVWSHPLLLSCALYLNAKKFNKSCKCKLTHTLDIYIAFDMENPIFWLCKNIGALRMFYCAKTMVWSHPLLLSCALYLNAKKFNKSCKCKLTHTLDIYIAFDMENPIFWLCKNIGALRMFL